MKTEVLVFAYELLGRDIPEELRIDPMLIETVGNVLSTRRGAYTSARPAEYYEELYEGEVAAMRERAAETVREAEQALQARRSQALHDATLRGLRRSLTDYRMEGVRTEVRDYFGEVIPEMMSVNGGVKDMDVVVRHYWQTAVEKLSDGAPYHTVVRVMRPGGAVKPMPIFLAAVGYYGGSSPKSIFMNGELIDDPRQVPIAWERAVDALDDGRLPAQRIEMVGKDGQPVPFPPEIEALYSAS
ncbi:MAG: hypothetical protein HN337_08300 [Deltaproteobacteria bacterium]|nr:hypothetical protein [Deltaproteobacteria bacterium]